MTQRLFRSDPYLLEFDARVAERTVHQGRPAVVLDRTAFYAESGGQPWDTGRLGVARVESVLEREDGAILHVLDRPLPTDDVHGSVDGERRGDHRQQHLGQHLLSRALLDLAQARTVSFHLGTLESTIDLDREVAAAVLRRAELLVAEVVGEARPVQVRVVTRAAAEALRVKAPADAGDEIRLVEAEGFDLQPCGGTHPRSTAEVGPVLVLGADRYKGGSRLRFVCGRRAVAAAAAQGALLDRLRALLSAPQDGLEDALRRNLERSAEAERRSRDLLARAVRAEARWLLAAASGVPAVVVERRDDVTAEELRLLAAALAAAGPCVALLGGVAAGKAQLVFAQSDGLSHDVPGLLRSAAELLGGRGGGRGNLAQGGGDRVDRLDEALATAAAAVRASP